MNLVKHIIIAALTFTTVSGHLTMNATEGFLNEIVKNNPSLLSIKAQNEALKAAGRAGNSLSGPEAEFEFLKGRNGATKWSAGISQSFDWPGLYGLRKTSNELNNSVNDLLYEARRIEILTEANAELVRYKYIKERYKLLSDINEALTRLENSLKTALDHGLVTILDYKKAGMERLSISRDIRLNIAEQAEIRSNLDQLAGRVLPWEQYSPAMTPALTDTLDTYLEIARRSDPAYLAGIVSIEAASKEMEITKAETLPVFTIGYRHEREEGVHFNGFAVGVSLPTWGVSARKSASAAALKAVKTDISGIGSTLTARITNEWKQAKALQLDLEDIGMASIDSTYLQLLTMAYEGGELSVLDYIRELAYCREAAMNIIDLQERYELVMSSLNRYSL